MATKCKCGSKTKKCTGKTCKCEAKKPYAFAAPIQLLRELKQKADKTSPVFAVALERDNGYITRYDLPIPAGMEKKEIVKKLCERIVKFLLWSSGGYKICVAGPSAICKKIKADYQLGGARDFDAKFFKKVYRQDLTVKILPFAKMPKANERALKINAKSNGCRLGFDLGASDFKISAVKNGKVTFSDEFPWDPRNQADPDYHLGKLDEGLKKAAATLPRVDAIGGSTAGVVIDNYLRSASLLRAVEEKNAKRFEEGQSIFYRLQKQWNVPVEVANDGDVTALCGMLTMGKKGILGVAMGSSEAAGFINTDGCLTGRLTELAFAPVDLSDEAPADEWSGDTGVGAMYFSQQAVNFLACGEGFKFPKTMPLPERLKVVQQAMADNDPRALRVYQRIGLNLAHTVPWYREFYDFNSLMILGRVTTGMGGVIILETARMMLKDIYPETAAEVEIFMPDEKARRLGQSVAAASLPEL